MFYGPWSVRKPCRRKATSATVGRAWQAKEMVASTTFAFHAAAPRAHQRALTVK